jgi:hypothetical protein
MGHIYAFLKADRVEFTGQGCDDYTEESGWIDRDWSLTELHESRNDVRPVISEDEGSEDLADQVREILGNPLHLDGNGEGTFYLPDEYIAEDGSSWTYRVLFTRKHHDSRNGWIEDDWHPVRDGGVTL